MKSKEQKRAEDFIQRIVDNAKEDIDGYLYYLSNLKDLDFVLLRKIIVEILDKFDYRIINEEEGNQCQSD